MAYNQIEKRPRGSLEDKKRLRSGFSSRQPQPYFSVHFIKEIMIFSCFPLWGHEFNGLASADKKVDRFRSTVGSNFALVPLKYVKGICLLEDPTVYA